VSTIPPGVTHRFRVFVGALSSEGIGSSLPVCASALASVRSPVFPCSPCVLVRPGSFPSCGFAPLQGLLPKVSLAPLDASYLSWEFRCRSAYAFRRSPLFPRLPPLGYGPRSGLLTLFAASSSFGLAGLFRPADALRLRPSGVSPPREPRCSSTAPCRPVVFQQVRTRWRIGILTLGR